MDVRWSVKLVICICLWAFIYLGSASAINCTCKTVKTGKTACAIANESWISDESGCDYSWSDGEVVVANQHKKDPKLVESYNINELVTNRHLNNTAFSRHCKSEKKKYTANCLRDSNSGHVIVAVVVGCVVVLLLAVGGILGFLFYRRRRRRRRRDGTPRDHCLSRFKHFWTRVRTTEDPEAAENEML